ncbi:MAG: hypothetical protein CVV05_15375 [Gammaproteobacteria bacterium HGW-Gammaproteobacteria-1]|jgi:hypothetical protein|nr:MAG: hypothetical protein CVV05_15375 [Gammaproteobacteria bacterium HGW-Gammaproteobacteria-1]
MAIRKLQGGRWQADIADKRRGIPRVKRAFDTKKEAQEWEAAVRAQAHDRLLGHRARRLFGEALAEYLRTESPHKKTHGDDLSNARALRYPVQAGRRWLRLEQVPLDDSEDGIIAAFAKWQADQKAVLRRAYVGNEIYQLRRNERGEAWYHQPDPADGSQPAPRYEVTDPALLARLARTRGRGPYSASTLRVRGILVSHILTLAWKKWRWIKDNLAAFIEHEDAAPGREADLGYEQLLALIIAAPVGLDAAILAGAWIGWRRANILGRAKTAQKDAVEGLTWSRVVFPISRGDELLQAGYILAPGGTTKNGAPLAQPMSERVEQLLRLMWDWRAGDLVFHRGDGTPWHEFRRIWVRIKKAAGIPADFRWHDLRHVWASAMVRAGVVGRHLQELGGWKDAKMPNRYAHLNLEHLLDAVNAPARKPL